MAKEPKRVKNKDNAKRAKKKISLLNQERVEYVDYKDVNLLRRFMSDRAKIRARRVTGNDSQQQREVARAIKNAREMALLPYTTRVTTQRKVKSNDNARPWRRGDRGDRPRPKHRCSRRRRRGHRRWPTWRRSTREGRTPFRCRRVSAARATSSKSPTATPATSSCRVAWRSRRRPGVEAQAEGMRRSRALQAGDRARRRSRSSANCWAARRCASRCAPAKKASSSARSVRPTSCRPSSKQLGVTIERRQVELPEPIKAVGTYQVPVELHSELTVPVTVEVGV